MIIYSDTEADFSHQLTRAGDRAVVVDFFAPWCGACKASEPQFEALASKYADCVFIKVDVDKNATASAKFQITGLPTFVVFHRGVVLERVVGANVGRVEQLLQNFLQTHRRKEISTMPGGQPLGGSATQNPWKTSHVTSCDPNTNICTVQPHPAPSSAPLAAQSTAAASDGSMDAQASVPSAVQDAFQRRKQRYLSQYAQSTGQDPQTSSYCGIM
uniref:Thioredoxin-2 n=1 Tax=Lygus hesperus TaxID=30085 RepID=A0A0A9YIG1_LYGHE